MVNRDVNSFTIPSDVVSDTKRKETKEKRREGGGEEDWR